MVSGLRAAARRASAEWWYKRAVGSFTVRPVGVIRSELRDLAAAPRQGSEGAPDAWLQVDPAYAPALRAIKAGDELVILTWLHKADRGQLETHPRLINSS